MPGTITQSQGPSILGPASGNLVFTKLECVMAVRSVNLSKTVSSDMVLRVRPSQLRLSKFVRGVGSVIKLLLRSIHVSPWFSARGETSEISFSDRSTQVRFVKFLSGDISEI